MPACRHSALLFNGAMSVLSEMAAQIDAVASAPCTEWVPNLRPASLWRPQSYGDVERALQRARRSDSRIASGYRVTGVCQDLAVQIPMRANTSTRRILATLVTRSAAP